VGSPHATCPGSARSKTLARVLLSGIFMSSGVDVLRNPEPRAVIHNPMADSIHHSIHRPRHDLPRPAARNREMVGL
jgi:hypothetical protein